MSNTARRLTEAVARAIYQNRAAFRREHGLAGWEWDELSEQTRESYREMARAAGRGAQGGSGSRRQSTDGSSETSSRMIHRRSRT